MNANVYRALRDDGVGGREADRGGIVTLQGNKYLEVKLFKIPLIYQLAYLAVA